jgi:acyl carrier protein
MEPAMSTSARPALTGSDTQRILGVVAETLDIEASDIDLDTDLHGTGRLDSLAVVALVAFVEDELGLKLAVGEIVPRNFSSVRRIAELVERARR